MEIPIHIEPLYKPVGNPDVIPAHIVLPIFFLLVGPPTLFFILLVRRLNARPAQHRTATVLVLGDIGRSPRMMYHAESLAKHGWKTFLVGYDDTSVISGLVKEPLVQIFGLAEPPRVLGLLPWIARAPIRVLYQVVSVLYICIWKIPCHTEVMLVQNPPSIPTLALAQFVSLVAGTKLIIDWHNTGYSILGMRVGDKSPLVKVAKWFESTFGQNAYAHLFVTRALQEYLVRDWDLKGRVTVLHDRPPPSFHPTAPLAQHELFQRLIPTLTPPLPSSLPPNDPDSTIFTRISSAGMPVLRSDRPALVVSSTSWTADEDFSLLVTALDAYQAARTAGAALPKLVVLITGKGSLRAAFEKTVAARERSTWKDITVRCVFLPARAYPVLLGCADLGVSLHSSSSGKDLPMKVVDLFGCGVPVLARGFECIGELVKEGVNGRAFGSGEEMGEQLIDTLTSYPESQKLNELKAFLAPSNKPKRKHTVTSLDNGEEEEWTTWADNWDRVVYNGLLSQLKR
ncbi:hypothetical protein IAT38_008116 [Cryptococcus sp. DSM 104549]